MERCSAGGERRRRTRGTRLLWAWIAAAAVAGLPGLARAAGEADVYVARGVLEYDEKNFTQALEDFKRARQLDPEATEPLYYLGLTYIALEDYGQAVVTLEEARQKDPKNLDVAYQLGVAYFGQDQLDRALPHFLAVSDVEPDRENLGYYLGYIYFQRGDYLTASGYFRRNVSTDPNYQQLAQYYAGLTNQYLGLREEAAAQVSEIIRTRPDSPLASAARRFLEATATARREERRFHFEVRVNRQYDDNVRVSPTTDVTGGLLFPPGTRNASPGILLYGKADYTFLRTDRYEGTATFSYLHILNDSLNQFNVQDLLAGGNLVYKRVVSGMPFFAGVQYTYDYLFLDYRGFVQRHNVSPYMSLIESPMFLTTVFYRYQNKDFFNFQRIAATPEENRDGFNNLVGFLQFLRFEADRHYIKAGYQYDNEQTAGSNYSYWGHKGVAGLQYTFPLVDIRLTYNFEYHTRSYKNVYLLGGAPTIFGATTKRQDVERTHLWTFSKDFPIAELGATVSPSLELLVDRNSSNISLFDFHRAVFSAGVSFRY